MGVTGAVTGKKREGIEIYSGSYCIEWAIACAVISERCAVTGALTGVTRQLFD